MNKVAFVFIVLVYRDYLDLEDLCESLSKNIDGTYQVIVVDSFFDEQTSIKVKEKALLLGCDYLSIENKGYSYGNNCGLEYANKHYCFKWAVVCNPDTMLKSKISINTMKHYCGIVAPNIITKTGKHQNPYWAIENKVSEKFIYYGYKNDKKLLIYFGVGINKIIRIVYGLINKVSCGRINRIYACHGSFIFIPNKVAKTIKFDEDLFLFYEEACLAVKAKEIFLSSIYDRNIIVFHKEDGSMGLANIKEYPLLKKSYITYYRKYRLAKKN